MDGDAVYDQMGVLAGIVAGIRHSRCRWRQSRSGIKILGKIRHDSEWRGIFADQAYGRASHPALRNVGASDQFVQRTNNRRSHQRSRPLRQGSRDRCFASGSSRAAIYRPRSSRIGSRGRDQILARRSWHAQRPRVISRGSFDLDRICENVSDRRAGLGRYCPDRRPGLAAGTRAMAVTCKRSFMARCSF